MRRGILALEPREDLSRARLPIRRARARLRLLRRHGRFRRRPGRRAALRRPVRAARLARLGVQKASRPRQPLPRVRALGIARQRVFPGGDDQGPLAVLPVDPPKLVEVGGGHTTAATTHFDPARANTVRAVVDPLPPLQHAIHPGVARPRVALAVALGVILLHRLADPVGEALVVVADLVVEGLGEEHPPHQRERPQKLAAPRAPSLRDRA